MGAATVAYSKAVVNNLNFLHQYQAERWLILKDGSKELAAQLHEIIYPNSRTRYRFHSNDQEAAAKAIFEASFQANSRVVIAAAERDEGISYYPLWKRVSLIYLPQVVSEVLRNKMTKVLLYIATGYFVFTVGFQIYAAIEYGVAARAVPYIINHIPVEVIRVFNTAIGYLSAVYENWTSILFYTWAARSIILFGPEIPYFTPAVRGIDIQTLFWGLIRGPQTIGGFLLNSFYSASEFVSQFRNDMGQFFLQVAEKADSERLMLSKQRAYALWMRVHGMQLA